MEKWECTVCRATAEIDVSVQPVVYKAHYPEDTGPYGNPRAHRCPIKQGLLTERLAEHPNARKVA
jgi:hypothetical protein